MKCVGSDNPPCARCAKAGRECIVQKPDRTPASDNSSGFQSDINRQSLGHQQNVTNSNLPYAGDGSTPRALDAYANQVWRKDEGLFSSHLPVSSYDHQSSDFASHLYCSLDLCVVQDSLLLTLLLLCRLWGLCLPKLLSSKRSINTKSIAKRSIRLAVDIHNHALQYRL